MLLPWAEQCNLSEAHVSSSTASKSPPTHEIDTTSPFPMVSADEEGELVGGMGSPLPPAYGEGENVDDGVATPWEGEDDLPSSDPAPPTIGDGVVVSSITAGAGVTAGVSVGAGVGRPGQEVGHEGNSSC